MDIIMEIAGIWITRSFRLTFYTMVVMEASLKDLCSSSDTHAAHALINRSTQLRSQ